MKPCPFCGGKSITLIAPALGIDDDMLWSADCMSCSAKLQGFLREAEAAAAWDKRAGGHDGLAAACDAVAAYVDAGTGEWRDAWARLTRVCVAAAVKAKGGA